VTSILLSMLFVQALVVVASLGVAVIAPILGPEVGLLPAFASFYATSVYCAAAVGVLPAPLLVARYGALRVSQVTLLLAAAGLIALTIFPVAGLALSGVAIGLAYGPNNPASSHLLAKHTPPHLRARIFSLKQTSVPLGGVAAGLAIPFITENMGWRAALLAAAAGCLLVAIAIQPLRRRLDGDRNPIAPIFSRALLDPLRMISRGGPLRVLAVGSAAFCALQFTFTAMFVTFLSERAALPLQSAGQALAFGTGASLLARPFWGWLADRFTSAFVLALVGLVMGSASIFVALITPDWSFPAIIGLSCIIGATAIGWNGVYLAEVARVCGPKDVARATSGTMFVTFLGALSGPLIYGLLARMSGSLALGFVILGAVASTAGVMFLVRARVHTT
jgi:MFS family permease